MDVCKAMVEISSADSIREREMAVGDKMARKAKRETDYVRVGSDGVYKGKEERRKEEQKRRDKIVAHSSIQMPKTKVRGMECHLLD